VLQFSIGVEYALHCLLYMVDIPSGKAVGIKDLAAFQGVSETYLSKVYKKYHKKGLEIIALAYERTSDAERAKINLML